MAGVKGKSGGKREGAGRPSNGELINIRQILDEAIDPKMVTEMLKQRIESGDQRAIELYLKYRAGVPKQEIDLNTKSDVDLNVTLKGLVGFSDE
jgi:hypothetical protein|tara:strand:- start:1620 stop:1901 length:282 start_codon:yes stop_codon:yes gene_type:complete